MLAKVKHFSFAFMSQMIKRPEGSMKSFSICKLKLLLKSMHTPALLLL